MTPTSRLLIASLLASLHTFAQTASIGGQITDESGAIIPGAKVTLTGPANSTRSTVSSSTGAYSFIGLAPGDYTLDAAAPDLALAQPVKVALSTTAQTVNLQLRVVMAAQHVAVEEHAGPAVATDASSNASALILHGENLQALSDDPEDLQADLQALAGPSAGPNGGAIFVDGFSGGQLPSKDSIREIRINQNPFSPEYDKLGFGRVEIFTKPGTDRFRGTGFYNFGDSIWNSRDPFASEKAPFELKEYGGNVSGPLGKRASFILDIQRHAIDNGAIIHAITLDPQTLAVIDPFTNVFRTPQRRIVVSPRIDYQLNSNNTLVVRYNFTTADVLDSGIGSLNLISRGDHAHSTAHLVQATETAVLGASIINETRFQFFRTDASMLANSPGPSIQVLGSFNGGGSPIGQSFNTQNSYEFQNYTSVSRGVHAWRFGVRVRTLAIDDISDQNFGGTFTFGGNAGIDSIDLYRLTLLHAAGGIPTQFSITRGQPALAANQTDVGIFGGDEWRVRPNITLSLGLRYEAQTNVHDWRDIAPRAGIAWAPGAKSGKSRPKSVIRGGFGMFYDRFALANVLTALRYNGIVQQQFVINDPDFYPNIPPLSALESLHSVQTIEQISPTMRAPYVMQSAVSFERQLPFDTTVALTYADSHGVHQLRSTVALPTANANPGPIFVMESSGLYNQQQLITNVNSRVNRNISLFGYYVYNRALSNTDGLGTFPANPYDYSGEYGPAAADIHHRASVGGSISTKWDIRLSPLFIASTGPPFDITTGNDPYGTTLFNARPGIATDLNKPGLIETAYGLLDPNPAPGEKILPRNFGRGPGSILFNVRFSKVFNFGSARETAASSGGISQPGGGGGERRGTPGVFGGGGGSAAAGPGNRHYSLSLSLSVRNILNHTNPGPIIGDITSPLFGRANQTAGAGTLGGTNFLETANNRRLELQARFTF